MQLQSRHLFTITIKLHPTVEMGKTPAGTRRVFAVSGGDFTGDRVRGIILPIVGSDLLLTRSDGSSQQDVRMLLRTEDDALILMTYRGVRHASREVNDRIAQGETVAASEYYLRRIAHSSHPTAHSPRGGDPGVLGEKPCSRLTPARPSGRPFAATRES